MVKAGSISTNVGAGNDAAGGDITVLSGGSSADTGGGAWISVWCWSCN